MDGNGRWARKRHLPREAGHVAGVNAVRETVRAALRHRARQSHPLRLLVSENWKRPKTEVGALMGLFRAYFRNDMDELVERNVRMRIIGNRGRVATDIQQMIEDAEKPHRSATTASISPSPSIMAGRKRSPPPRASWRAPPRKAGSIPKPSRRNCFATRLFTSALPEPDLVIRTSGEHRLSNFLLWQSAYAELLFVDTLWPDFDRADC